MEDSVRDCECSDAEIGRLVRELLYAGIGSGEININCKGSKTWVGLNYDPSDTISGDTLLDALRKAKANG